MARDAAYRAVAARHSNIPQDGFEGMPECAVLATRTAASGCAAETCGGRADDPCGTSRKTDGRYHDGEHALDPAWQEGSQPVAWCVCGWVGESFEQYQEHVAAARLLARGRGIDELMSALMRPSFIRAMARAQCNSNTPRGQGATKRLRRAEVVIDAIVRHYAAGTLRYVPSRHREQYSFDEPGRRVCSCGRWDSRTSSHWFEEHAYGRD